MPNTREKLIELLGQVQQQGSICTISQMDDRYATIRQVSNDEVADHLIANGVTVKEMNVVDFVRCKDCVYFRPAEDWNGKNYNACYLKPNVCIFEKKEEDFCSCGERRLPQPPKGE